MRTALDPTTISPGTVHTFGPCTVEIGVGAHPRRPWTWRVCWVREEAEGVGGEAETKELAQLLAAETAERVSATFD